MEDGTTNQQSHAATEYPHEAPARADIDEILRRKRKAREYKVRWSGWTWEEQERDLGALK